MNHVTLCGNLGKGWETYQGQYGLIAKNTIAVNEWYNKDGQTIQRTQWIPLIAFGRTGEIIAKYASRGDKILIQGKMVISQWITDDGETRNSFSVQIERFEFIQPKKDDRKKPVKSKIEVKPADIEQSNAKEAEFIHNNTDEIPF